MRYDASIPGFGIAGNFAHHLEQAGESRDFVDVAVDEAHAPKGIFPFYLPNHPTFLGIYPASCDTIVLKAGEDLQMEPEVALLCDVDYVEGVVSRLRPLGFTAFNDCSIRREGAPKISHKKNWGASSKGVAEKFVAIDTFSHGGVCDFYHIASYLKRGGKLFAYGETSPMTGYSYFYEKLLGWMVSKFATQHAHGPLENVGEYLAALHYPKQLLISIGATRYTPFGETHFLEAGDELFVVLFDARKTSAASIEANIAEGKPCDPSTVVLHQHVKETV